MWMSPKPVRDFTSARRSATARTLRPPASRGRGVRAYPRSSPNGYIDTMLQPVAFVLRLLERVEQLGNHLLEHAHVIGQQWWLGGGSRRSRVANRNVRAHVF